MFFEVGANGPNVGGWAARREGNIRGRRFDEGSRDQSNRSYLVERGVRRIRILDHRYRCLCCAEIARVFDVHETLDDGVRDGERVVVTYWCSGCGTGGRGWQCSGRATFWESGRICVEQHGTACHRLHRWGAWPAGSGAVPNRPSARMFPCFGNFPTPPDELAEARGEGNGYWFYGYRSLEEQLAYEDREAYEAWRRDELVSDWQLVQEHGVEWDDMETN